MTELEIDELPEVAQSPRGILDPLAFRGYVVFYVGAFANGNMRRRRQNPKARSRFVFRDAVP